MQSLVMEINGLPLHVLVIHAVVIIGPVAALSGVVYAVVPALRDRLRWVTLTLVLIAAGAAWLAYFSGKDFIDTSRFAFLDDPNATPSVVDRIRDHENLGEILPWVTSGFAAVTVAATLLHERTGAVRIVLSVLVVGGALATAVYTFLTGEAGSRAVWGT
jgi:hypothetical protein